MVDGLENPYRSDNPADALFVGREEVLGELVRAVRSGRNAVRAVMGGRGMGKSSLAEQVAKRLQSDALTISTSRTSGGIPDVVRAVRRGLGVDLVGDDPVDSLVDAIRQHPSSRVLLVLDEVERLLEDPAGNALLQNLRAAYERAEHRLALIVLGGTSVRDLLTDHASPFLRIAGGFHVLRGLSREDTAKLIREPLGLVVDEGVEETLWAETAGHPWLIQMFMEEAVERARSLDEVVSRIPEAIADVTANRLHEFVFSMWWGNLRDRGQTIYRRIVKQRSPISRPRWVEQFGNDPEPWLNVLASTGVISVENDAALARGMSFRRWVEETHRLDPQAPAPNLDALDGWLSSLGADAFERLVVRTLAVWARATVEFPAAALKMDSSDKVGNSYLLPELSFQVQAIVALNQHGREVSAEPEALSMKARGRSDIKVRSKSDTERRACVEFKIHGRNDYKEVVKQAIGYSMPNDTFAAVVMVDRCNRPLQPEYLQNCFEGAQPSEKYEAPALVMYPQLYTVQSRENTTPLRVWHFLVQLRDA